MIALLITSGQVVVVDVEHGSVAPVSGDALANVSGRVLQVREPTDEELAEMGAFRHRPDRADTFDAAQILALGEHMHAVRTAKR